MKNLLLAVALFTSSACMYQTVDVGYGKVACSERCSDGCCIGDPAHVNTVCVRFAEQDDSACGSRAQECYQCGPQKNYIDGGTLTTTCAMLAEYHENTCVIKD